MKRLRWNTLTDGEKSKLLARPALSQSEGLRERVSAILARVRQQGDKALFEFAAEFDRVRLDSLAVSAEELDAAETHLTAAQRQAIGRAAANIEAFHRAQRTAPVQVETQPGVVCERVVRPLQRVGLYVPAGSAPLPSTALMLGVPARLAGCPLRVLCSPPQSDGNVSAAVLYAARLCDIRNVFKIGGAQAIAAMAYGTETVPKVDKVFGPGNAWVTQAKTLVSEDPGAAAQDMPAGPSEVMVIADDSADPEFVASDLLSQAEHGADSQAVLVTTSDGLADAVLREIERQTPSLSRRTIAERSLEQSLLLLVDSIGTAIEVANAYAPEHLILQMDQPREWLDQIQAAGSIFVGPWAPESIGDYCSGTNHILPTYGFAKSYSSLGLADFQRAMTIQELTRDGLGALGPTAETLAMLEGLDGHAGAVSRRLAKLGATGGWQ